MARSIVLGGFDVVGEEDGFVLGAGRKKRRSGGKVARVKVPAPKWMNATTSQGVSRPQEEMDFLPFEPVVLTALIPTGFLLARPQRPFRSERLIMSAADEDGDDAAAGVVIDPAIYLGAVQVGASQGATPIQAFAANAFGVRLSMPAAGQGTDVKIYVRGLAIAVAPATVTVTATMIGRAMR
jgi:hypothetical protein